MAADEGAGLHASRKDDLGKVPAGWKAAQTGKGEGSVWKVVADETAPVEDPASPWPRPPRARAALFNLCVAEDTQLQGRRGDASPSRPCAGKKDQGGGIVWRYQDANNYYVARMNPLEDNFRVYKVVAGKRTPVRRRKEDLKVPAGEWHTLKVKMTGDKIECFLDGKKYLDAKDDTFTEGRQGRPVDQGRRPDLTSTTSRCEGTCK